MIAASSTGLTAAEVADRIARGQVNRVRRSDRAEYLDILARNVLTLFNALVVPAAVALFLLNDYNGALAVSGMATANLALGLIQELRAKRHLDRLTLLTEGTVRVRRDGQVVEIATGEVVRDDVIQLAAGDTVPADGVVTEARFLEIDEALLTGESDPVPRHLGERLLSGSFCVAGEGAYRADKVGTESFAQRTAAEARAYRYNASPLQQSINRLLQILTAVAVALCALYGVLYFVRGDISQKTLAQMVAATITSMVPQGLVLMATLAFILGAWRMSLRGAIVQRLSAVESMASIDTLCMDKTGTLTTNRLKLERLHVLSGSASEEAIRERLRRVASTSLDRASKSLAALRTALGEVSAELIDQLPFKSQNRYSAVRVRKENEEWVLALGAPEALLPLVANPQEAQAVEAAWKELMKTGLRLLLFTEADGDGRSTFNGSLVGFTLRPLALLGLSDEVRPEARRVLEALAEQGIEFKILSGDNAETVRATVEPLGRASACQAVRALAETPVVTGAELEAGDVGELVLTRCVFGRVSPGQKVQVVEALKAQGRRVAMVGDGVNDVLPIKTADLGVAMGEGSRAAKTVSGLVLETNNFELLPQTLDEGRTILRNLRRAGKLFLLKNVFTLILIIGTLAVFRLPFPFLPQQVTLLNFLTIGVPSLLIMFGQGGAGVIRTTFVREVGGFALRRGAVIGVAGLVVLLLAKHVWQVAKEEEQRTFLLTTLVLLGLDSLMRVLADNSHTSTIDRWLRWWIVAALPGFLLAMYLPWTASFFELAPLSWIQWAQVFGIVAPAAALARLSD